MMNRRSFLGALASLPLMGPLFSGEKELTARTAEVVPDESWGAPIVTELHWKLVNGRLNAMMSINRLERR
jgi:hypothetical protein